MRKRRCYSRVNVGDILQRQIEALLAAESVELGGALFQSETAGPDDRIAEENWIE